jgi:G3E family GTPase
LRPSRRRSPGSGGSREAGLSGGNPARFEEAQAMIPVALVTGFLGSGKTTFLRHCAELYRSRKIVYLVNEFSAKDVDGALLRHEAADVISVAGGSIFCRCLVTEFLAALRDLPSRFGSCGSPVEGVVIEASGMADPRVAVSMLAEARLDKVYELATILSVADPGSLLKLLHTLPAVRWQIESSDAVLLNKTDAYPAALVESAAEVIRDIQPRARILRTQYCRAEIGLFGASGPRTGAGEYARCRDPRFETVSARLPGALDVVAFRSAVESLADDVYRIKGFADVDGRRRLLDFSSSGFQLRDVADAGAPELVFILRGPATSQAMALVRSTEAGAFCVR